MPIYEYRCKQCGNELEKIQRMSDEPLRDCPACEQPELQRLVSAAGFRLKGGGWYETDFKQGQKRNLAESGNDETKPKSGDAKTGSGEGPAKDSDAKPASKDPAKTTPKKEKKSA